MFFLKGYYKNDEINKFEKHGELKLYADEILQGRVIL